MNGKTAFIAALIFALGSNAYAVDVSELIQDPSLGDGVKFYDTTSQVGLCKSLGYEGAADGSAVKTCGDPVHGNQPEIDVTPDGVISPGVAGSSCWISQVICFNKVGSPKWVTTRIPQPRDSASGAPFSMKSDPDGVCKALGHAGSVDWLRDGHSADGLVGPQVVVDKNGDIIGGDLGSDVCSYMEFACYDKN